MDTEIEVDSKSNELCYCGDPCEGEGPCGFCGKYLHLTGMTTTCRCDQCDMEEDD